MLEKAEQANGAPVPVVLIIAPGIEFSIPWDKIPIAVERAFRHGVSGSLSAVVFTGGGDPVLCDSVAEPFRNPNDHRPELDLILDLFRALRA